MREVLVDEVLKSEIFGTAKDLDKVWIEIPEDDQAEVVRRVGLRPGSEPAQRFVTSLQVAIALRFALRDKSHPRSVRRQTRSKVGLPVLDLGAGAFERLNSSLVDAVNALDFLYCTGFDGIEDPDDARHMWQAVQHPDYPLLLHRAANDPAIMENHGRPLDEEQLRDLRNALLSLQRTFGRQIAQVRCTFRRALEIAHEEPVGGAPRSEWKQIWAQTQGASS